MFCCDEGCPVASFQLRCAVTILAAISGAKALPFLDTNEEIGMPSGASCARCASLLNGAAGAAHASSFFLFSALDLPASLSRFFLSFELSFLRL
jgi:hypothetical protein